VKHGVFGERMAIGRISGPLLKSNLLRDGVDLSFETDLLYLNVTDRRIGINTVSPQYSLDVGGTTRTTDLEVTNEFNVGNFTISNNTIRSTLPTISFIASGGEATAYHSRLLVNDIELNGNRIETVDTNTNLELRANGTGIVDIQNNARVNGDLEVIGNISATGNITINGNLIIGDAITDTITINASIASSLIPDTTDFRDLGSSTFRWRDLHARTITASFLNLSTFNIGNLVLTDNSITTTAGQNLILDANGSGSVRIGNFAISGNTIRNVSPDAITEIAQSGTGYFKIQGTNGFVPPSGNTSQRPTLYAVEGMLRYNTDSKALELWDGNDWSSPSGASGALSETVANDIALKFALTLG